MVMLFSLVGCGPAKPEDTVEKYLTAAQKFDVEAMATNIAPSNTEDIDETTDITKEQEQDDYTKYFLDYLKTNAGKMTYKITGSEVNGDKAVVTVDCKYVDGGSLLKATIGEAFSKMLGLAFTDIEMTDEETSQMFVSIMKEQSKKIGETFSETTVKVDCVKMEGQWYIAEINDELHDVVMSGFVSAGKEVSASFNGNEDTTEDGDLLKDDPADVLADIDNYITDLWNDGFCEISWYLSEGTGSTGQEIDIDFTKSQLIKAMKKKTGYDEYVAGLDSNYSEIKEVWNKMSPQIDSMYQQVQSGATSLNTDLFTQYHDAFSDLVNDL